MRLSHATITLRQRQPFVTNKGKVDSTRQVLIRLHFEGRTGLGTGLIGAGAKLSEDQVLPALDQCARVVAAASPFQFEQIVQSLEKEGVPPAAAAAVDMAIHDLLGRLANRPCRDLLGLSGLTLGPSAVSLGAADEATLLQRVRDHADWPILKLKLTRASDPRVVSRVRSIYSGRIWVDGNGCWDEAGAHDAALLFEDCGVELLEQPLPPGRPRALAALRRQTRLPIVADEDCSGPADVPSLAGCVDAIVVKLHRCGGLRRADEMIRLAHRLGLRVMLGCVTESSLGVTAAAQLAGLADYLDLDGHLDLTNDPYRGVTIRDGWVSLPDGPGFGVAELPDAVTPSGHSALIVH